MNKNMKQKFVVLGGCIQNSIKNVQDFEIGDVDIFLIENGQPTSESEKIFQTLLLNVEKNTNKLQYNILK